MSKAPRRSVRLLRHSGARLGLILMGLVLLPALLAPWLPLADPTATAPASRMLPTLSLGHVLGTDHLGRDLLARLVWGARSSLMVGLLATAIAALAGTLIGLLAGFFGRWVDALLMRGIDVLMAFPYLLLALAIVAALGPGLGNAMIAIAVANIPFFARAVRGAVLGIRQEAYIDAARVAGLSGGRILAREVFPNLLPTVLVMATATLGWMILETAGLSFLGLGAQPPKADLGSMLGEGREFLTTFPRVAILPGLWILLAVVGINLVGDGLRDLIDPRQPHALPGPPPAPGDREQEPVAPAPAALLRLSGLTVEFPGPSRPVDGVSFAIEPGERLALVGESGCGKTLTALSLLRLVPPPGRISGGEIHYRGEALGKAPPARWRRLRGGQVGYVPQEPLTALDPLFTIGAQITEALRAHRRISRSVARPRVRELLEAVHLPDPESVARSYPHQLSGGMRQRAAIAMALANDPAMLIADEATTALDVSVQRDILQLLDRLCRERGLALLFISHDLALVGGLCDRVLVMYAGQVLEDAPAPVLLERPRHPYSRALLECIPELGRPDKPLRAVPGRPPGAEQAGRGCAFEPRCPHALDPCRSSRPSLRALVGNHLVRCIRAEELESKG